MKILIRLVLLLALAFAPAARAADDSVWKIEYLNTFPTPIVLYLGKNTLKITSPPGYVVLSNGPKWDAYIFNSASKECLFLPYAKWKKYGIGKLFADFPPLAQYEKVHGNEKIIGLAANHFSLKGIRHGALWRDRDKSMDCVYHYFGTDAIPTNESQREVFCAWLGVPLSKDLPLIWASSYGGENKFFISAKSATKLPYAASLFAKPLNYKTVLNTTKFYLSDQNVSTIESLVDIGTSEHAHK